MNENVIYPTTKMNSENAKLHEVGPKQKDSYLYEAPGLG